MLGPGEMIEYLSCSDLGVRCPFRSLVGDGGGVCTFGILGDI